MKHIRLYIFCSLLFCTAPLTSYADEFDDFSTDDSADIFADDPELDSSFSDSPDMSIKRSMSSEEVIESLLALGLIDLLKHNFYLRTNPLNKRSLLDYSIFFDQKTSYDFRWVAGVHGFYNQTNRANFTSNSTNICSYLGIADPALLADIQNAVNNIASKGGIPLEFDPLSFIPLFNNFTIQERRIGAMLHAAGFFDTTTIRFWLPLYYLERNFYATDDERDAVEVILGANTVDQQARFQSQHLVSDKFGLGDTRIEVDFQVIENEHAHLQLGLQTTIPTAVPLYSSIEGSVFHECPNRPTFDFSALFNNPTQGSVILQEFLTGALDKLAANLLDTRLGNNGHLGLGAYAQLEAPVSCLIDRPWTDNMSFWSKLKLEYLCPAHEQRYFVNQVNLADFNARDFNSDDQAADNLNFLNQQIVDRFYPYVLRTLVNPGIVFHWVGKTCYESKGWGGALGLDLWAQGPESLGKIDFCNVSCNNLNLNTATVPFAFQSKVVGNILFKATRRDYEWIASLNGDYTFASAGIGKDYMLSVNVEVNF